METLFHPLVRQWFASRFGEPTDIQLQSWPRIADRDNLLITAPTGSGKTLTAFLVAINRFITGELTAGTDRILYVSPLKALNNDIERNLIAPLAELKALFETRGEPFPAISVRTRSGDTPQEERRRMSRKPPDILITTPESLNLLLSSESGLGMLTCFDTVILDEIHGVVGNKRGVYLMSAVERLVPLSGEFQRIALSATVRPMEDIARFVGGHRLEGTTSEPVYTPRHVDIVSSTSEKRYEITVRFPESTENRPDDEKIWESMAADFVARIRKNRATLLFTNSRSLCEKLTHYINNAAGELLAYAHHGSLSREIRFDVEQKLKSGELAAIVATSTLEMGIDIGSLDEVILVQSPDAISSAIQRIGRAGHSVGEVSRCTVYPTHPLDFMEAAVLSKAVLEKDIEPVSMVDCPLDVLAQIIISMTGVMQWSLDELFSEVRRGAPYRGLTRSQFDLVVDMLAGRYADNHVRELRPKVNVDRIENTIRARPGALMSLYLSGGVIPDRGYFQIRHEDGNAKIGELDEEFVWEATVGGVFSFGTQQWRIRKITHNDVVVAPGRSKGIAPPFWKAEPLSRDNHYATRVGEFLEYADGRIGDDDFSRELEADYHMDEAAAQQLHDFLRRQKSHVSAPLPHRHHLLVERINMGPGRNAGHQVVFHTHWGARVNRPLALALEAGWEEAFGESPQIFISNESIVIQLPIDIDAAGVLALAPPSLIESRLRTRLEGSGFFGARFRENAGRALLLSKGRFNERKPLWMSRLQSQKLLESVMKYADFPMLLETWRTCLKDEFDLPHLKERLTEIENHDIALTEVTSQTPSPFAQGVAWGQINTYMYMTDQPKSAGAKTSSLSASLLEEVVFTPELRPAIPAEVIEAFEARRQRTLSGYGPETDAEIIEWVKERTAIPAAEFTWEMPAGNKLARLEINGVSIVVAAEDAPGVTAAFGGDDEAALATHLGNFLQYYGPRTAREFGAMTGLDPKRIGTALEQLAADKIVISGELRTDQNEVTWCDAGNFEILLRFLRQQARTHFEPLPAMTITPFIYAWQTRNLPSNGGDKSSVEAAFEVISLLRGYPASPALWEQEFLPARIADYAPATLDSLATEGRLKWIGTPDKQILFTFDEDLDLIPTPADSPPGDLDELLPAGGGRFDFATLIEKSGHSHSTSEVNEILWEGVWAGHVTNDSIGALRKGIEHDFRVPEAAALESRRGPKRLRRGSFNTWRTALPSAGNWYKIGYPEPADDLIAREELMKDRVRVVLDRYGILFRELLGREAPGFRWSDLFRSMRLMELSGELVSGYFMQGITGPQFMGKDAFRFLERFKPQGIFWINATDPASTAGFGFDELKSLPRRAASNHLVYHGDALVMVAERTGKQLSINVPAEDPNLADYVGVLRHLLYRSSNPVRKLAIETINGEPARSSAYLGALESAFRLVRDYKAVYLEREI